jgi:HSP20 family protein
MNLARFDPFRDLELLSSRLNRLFREDQPASAEGDGFGVWTPAIDVEETDAEYLIKADLPEVKKEAVKVGIEDGTLSIEGERRQEKEEKGTKYHRVERSYGRFVRRLTVPTDVNQSQVAAEFKDGVLKVHLPKAAEARPKSVDVKVV